MRIKIIGENNCARATRHLLRLAGFAVTEFLPADALAGPSFFRTTAPLAGYAITIELAPAHHTPDGRQDPPAIAADSGAHSRLGPDPSAHHPHAAASEEASHAHSRSHRGASSPASVPLRGAASRTGFSLSGSVNVPGLEPGEVDHRAATNFACQPSPGGTPQAEACATGADKSAEAPPNLRNEARIHFDSVESELETAVLRHVTQLAAAPVIVDRPGGVVRSDRELRIVAPNTGDARVDEAAAVAIEFGVLRGLLDLTDPAGKKKTSGSAAGQSADGEKPARQAGKKKWWPFGIVLFAVLGGAGVSPVLWSGASRVAPLISPQTAGPSSFRAAPPPLGAIPSSFTPGSSLSATGTSSFGARGTPALRSRAALMPAVLRVAAADPAQGQFATGQGIKITDGTNFLAVDPCAAQAKSYASINQTANAQLVTGTASKKVYVCSIHVVVAVAANVAVVEGTGTVCGSGTAGVSGFGGATAATGWNFAANGGLTLGSGASSLGAEGTSGDNLCIFNSGPGQVSGGISYVVE